MIDFTKLKPMPDRAILRITAKEREGIFSKKYLRPDGTSYSLIVTVDEQAGFDRKATLFCKTAEVVSVGRQVKNLEAGDIAILDYKVDNDEAVVLGWENGDKYVSVRAVSVYHDSDVWAYANRQSPKDIKVAKKGQLKNVSDVLGCIRGEKLIANDPYIFLEHRSHKTSIVSPTGIEYESHFIVAETKVLAVSRESAEKYNIEEGKTVLVKFDDIFDVELPDGTICACNDEDVLHQI